MQFECLNYGGEQQFVTDCATQNKKIKKKSKRKKKMNKKAMQAIWCESRINDHDSTGSMQAKITIILLPSLSHCLHPLKLRVWLN